MQLRSANNALEFQIQQKDEIINKLRGGAPPDEPKESTQASAPVAAARADDGERLAALSRANNDLQARVDSLIDQNSELEDKCNSLSFQLK